MVFEQLVRLLCDRCGCDPDEVHMGALLDDLNVTVDDRDELLALLWELFVAAPPEDDQPLLETVEDLVAYIEDRMG